MNLTDKDLLIQYIQNKKAINAIKLIREISGMSLKESLKFYNELKEMELSKIMVELEKYYEDKTETINTHRKFEELSANDVETLKRLLNQNKLIEAIRYIREITNESLKNCKEYLDKLMLESLKAKGDSSKMVSVNKGGNKTQ